MKQDAIVALATALVLTACGSPASKNKASPDDRTAAGNAAGGPDAVSTPPVAKAGNAPLYPGSRAGSAAGRFVTGDPIDKVVAWYKDPARTTDNMFVSSEKLDDGYLMLGTAGPGLKSFALKLKANDGGGTELRSIPYDPAVGLDRNLLKR